MALARLAGGSASGAPRKQPPHQVLDVLQSGHDLVELLPDGIHVASRGRILVRAQLRVLLQQLGEAAIRGGEAVVHRSGRLLAGLWLGLRLPEAPEDIGEVRTERLSRELTRCLDLDPHADFGRRVAVFDVA